MTCKKIRNFTGGLSLLQAKIMMIRGFTSEENLLSQKDFSKQLKRPLSTINYNIVQLKKKGLLTNLNFLTRDGKVVFQKIKRYYNNTKKLRAHKILGKFILAEDYKDFESIRHKYLKISEKHKGFKIEFKGYVVLFYTPKKIVFYLPDVYGDSIEEIYAEAYEQHIKPLEDYLQREFKGLRVDKYEIASITINHLALQNHPLAEIFKKFNVRYKSGRLEVDHSHGVAELETVHKKHCVEDMDKILEYENLVRAD